MVRFLFIFCFLLFAGCGSFYQQNYDFNRVFESGDLLLARKNLEQAEREGKGRNRFLYYVNQGLVQSMMGNYVSSNDYFEKAFLFGEDYRLNLATEAASYFTNPTITVYKGEDHEHLYLLYYKAINYLKLKETEAALIECRRLNIRLNQLNDKYNNDNKFQRDAFIHNLMGIIYQSAGDFNNAFIAYRNAFDIYESDYKSFFQVQTPEQLKTDLLTSAYFAGLNQEFEEFKTRFGRDNFKPTQPEAELVFFWHNGLAPIKDEWSINFAIQHLPEDRVVFNNDQLGIQFPFEVSKEEAGNLQSLQVFRVAFPRYLVRQPYYNEASIKATDTTYALELGEDISQIAVLSLRQRMVSEFSKGLLRAALKKTTENSLRKDNEGLGAVVGLVNLVTEKADTRNWQTLPSRIAYTRIPLKEGANELTFSTQSQGSTQEYPFTYQASKGATLFHTFSSLENSGLRPGY